MTDAPAASPDPIADWIASPEGVARTAAAAVPADLIAQVNLALGAKAAGFLQLAWIIRDPASGDFPLEPKVFAARLGMTSTSGLNSTMQKLADAGHITFIDKATARIGSTPAATS